MEPRADRGEVRQGPLQQAGLRALAQRETSRGGEGGQGRAGGGRQLTGGCLRLRWHAGRSLIDRSLWDAPLLRLPWRSGCGRGGAGDVAEFAVFPLPGCERRGITEKSQLNTAQDGPKEFRMMGSRAMIGQRANTHSAFRSARLPVNLIGSPINYANRLIGSPITSQSTARGNKGSHRRFGGCN